MATLPIRSSFATAAGNHRTVAVPAARALLLTASETLLVWLERASQRRRLRMLSDHMLRDIGLSRADVENESGKPFWRP